MTDSLKSPKLTCGSVALAGLLAVIVVAALYRQPRPPDWPATFAAAVAVVSVFLVARGLHNILWALAAAALLTFHPYWQTQGTSSGWGILAAALVLACLASLGICWQLAFHSRFAWRAWPPLFAALAGAAGLAWLGSQFLGVLSLLLMVAGMWTAVFLASRHRQRNPKTLPARANLFTAGSFIALVPAGGLLAYRFFDRSLDSASGWWPLVRDSFPQTLSWSSAAFSGNALASWCWPTPWLVVPLLVWALVLTVRRGWKQWSAEEMPSAWLLTLTVVILLSAFHLLPAAEVPDALVILVALVVLLLVFWSAEMLRHVCDRLVLRPPVADDKVTSASR